MQKVTCAQDASKRAKVGVPYHESSLICRPVSLIVVLLVAYCVFCVEKGFETNGDNEN